MDRIEGRVIRKADHLDKVTQKSWTYQYSQPENYHFCQDSVLFPAFVADLLKANGSIFPSGFNTLDVCAGCGVVGFELSHHLPDIKRMDFIEIQTEFEAHFAKNLEITGHSQDAFQFLSMNYERLADPDCEGKYDLIVGNPPYFFSNEGRLSSDQLNNRCRFFLDSDLPKLVRGCANALRTGGSAYLLIKSGHLHGRNSLQQIRLALAGAAEAICAGEVRGTKVIQLTKHSS